MVTGGGGGAKYKPLFIYAVPFLCYNFHACSLKIATQGSTPTIDVISWNAMISLYLSKFNIHICASIM